MIREKIGLIPRYNWDYKLSDLIQALGGIIANGVHSERTLEKIYGQKPIFTTSGRASLYVILKSLNLPIGSYVGVPLFCCPVVFGAIRQANLIPKFIDIDLDDYNLSVSDLDKKKDTVSTLVVVHMFGHPADMDSISKVCKDIPIIEDCAQSLLSRYKGNYTGFQSTASFFSFRSGKYISAGEGSAIFCKNPTLGDSIARFVEELEGWNSSREILHCMATYVKSTLYHKPWYGTLGYPIGRLLDQRFNLTAKSGFMLRKISKSDQKIIEDRLETFFSKINKQRRNATYLLENLKLGNAVLPVEREGCFSNYYQFAIRFKTTKQRDFMSNYLMKHGIDTAKYLDEVVDVVRNLYGYNGDCPKAELCSKTVLVIPHYYNLTDKDLDHIVNTLNDATHYLNDLI